MINNKEYQLTIPVIINCFVKDKKSVGLCENPICILKEASTH